ncbi:hypothetical protein A2Y85_05275 [candidate division WOR-3 bacterium RBG_13_43_14]|uniref:Secretion system C-terminal sorting domain-containing protein n=1 Tax=candidate division WOR-3 bacterium RBG_13_43_14 TaxID=1802590 RepID=A0A1F4UA63_UNCW3|nr:MAG: hypothetical protein A2Y85_05275 [candidate division WOR-3 bacterium RBG_13_43_14]
MVLVLILLQITGSGFHAETAPVITGTGGPDAYGYRWIDSDTAGGPTKNWIDISGYGTQVTGLGDDNVVGPFSIGFDFPYYWYTVNSFFVGSNGYIAFGDNTLEAAPFPTIPQQAKPNNMLAPFMSDLDFSAGTPACYYWTNAALDTFIISYHTVRFWNSPSSNNTFQIILTRADSAITFQYEDRVGYPSGGWAQALSVGIENVAGNVGLQYLYDQSPIGNQIHDSLALYFYPPDSTNYQVHDVAVMKMMNDISGGFFVYNGDSINFWGLIKNTGNQTETGFNVYCQIRNQGNQVVFNDTINVASIAPDATDSLVFTPKWASTANGLYRLKVKSLLGGDLVPNNDSIYVEFRVVTYPTELQLDGGTGHTGMAWNGPNSGYGAKFLPPRYPMKLNTARFNVNSTAANPNVTVQILDDDGPGNGPGTVLYQVVQPIGVAQWYDIDVSAQNIIFFSGAFYIGCISDQASDPFFSMDTLFPSSRQTWEYTGVWAPYRDKEKDDVLIRAVVDSYTGVGEYTISPVRDPMIAAPNPFQKLTAINVAPSVRRVAVYDASGRLITNVNARNGIANWNGCNDKGQLMNQGIYFAVTDHGDIVKLVLVK